MALFNMGFVCLRKVRKFNNSINQQFIFRFFENCEIKILRNAIFDKKKREIKIILKFSCIKVH